ncbi:MAG TPA: transglycosylase domain-containing protein [Jatrophihabitans sp.]|jgi:membrane peptidoglycan carboxypeptidase|nr:transglycosylase domain-containing protein [Jatrophihabitans sp.]
MARASGLTVLSKLGKLVVLLVIVGVLAAGLLLPYIGGVGLAAKAGADKFLGTQCNLTEEPVQQRTTMYANDGKTVIATLFDQNRQVVPLSRIPKAVTNALISTEDRRFYQHHGVDLRGLIRGALKTSNGDTQGASTLTEQYVKQVRYYQANTDAERAAAIDQNIDRKILDAQCALKIERESTKTEILEKYLNIAAFGENSYGIQTAAQTFFGVDVTKLTVPQAALLVGLVKAPTDLDPFVHPQAARDRRDLVISNMASENYISEAEAERAKASPLRLAPHAPVPRGCSFANPAIKNAGFFCDYVTDWLTKVGGLSESRVNVSGFKIVTTLNAHLQNQGQNAIWSQSGLDPAHGHGYLLAMPSITPSTGAVTTMITDARYGVKKGNSGYSVDKLFTKAYAGAGSTYKYFTALAALKAGVPPSYTLTTANNEWTTKNCPLQDDNKPYVAHNVGHYPDTAPLDHALPASSNTYFVAMEDQLFGCDISPIVNTATGLGMNYLNGPQLDSDGKPTGRTIAQSIIGSRQPTFTLGQDSTSVLELTGAFAALANDGVFCPPTPVRSVTDSTGKPVRLKPHPGCSRQFTPFVARTLVNIMVNDTHSGYGTASRFFTDWYNNGGSLVAGKTGTNNSSKLDPVTKKFVDDEGNSALWFVGITPNLVSAAALVNPERPTQRIAGVPGITESNSGTDTFGAAVSKFWMMAYGPTLGAQQWDWPSVDSTPGNPVPSVVGMGQDEAIQYLASQGFVGRPLPVPCGSRERPGNVAFYSPQIAEPGAAISLCISTGVPPQVYVPPIQTFQPQPQPPPSSNPQTSAPPSSSAPASSAPPPSPSPSPSKPKPTKPRR